ncbi:PREDICTED: cation/H(+) antiporter 24-like [Lupinus angustifolius]|nr:PREDICTED: cation/H(+) antiporter 24-like [Lupinus angustifolius]
MNNSTFETSIPFICEKIQDFHPLGIIHGDNLTHYNYSLLMFNFILVVTITGIIRLLLRPLKQPKVVSQIIGGIVLGPSVLKHSTWFKHYIIHGGAEYLSRNLGVMGFMFYVFIYGVKMDPFLLRKTGKVHLYVALVGISIPTTAVFVVGLLMRKTMEKEMATNSSIGIIAAYLGITAFPVLYNVLKEFNFLNSDVGRMALAMAIIGDAFGVFTVVVFEAGKQGEAGPENALWYMISLVVIIMIILFCIRPIMVWIDDNIPEGGSVNHSFVVAILLGVLVMGFITDFLGISIANGPLWLGLVIPDGPRLGATIIEKSETIMNDLLIPFSYLMVGSYTDVFAMSNVDWSSLVPLFTMVLTGYLTKFFSTWFAAIYWRIPFRDGLTLSFIMSLRGQIELILFVHMMDKKILKIPGFTLLVLITTIFSAIFTPLISILYDPTRPYIVSQRRNIQHNPPKNDLTMVVCIFDTRSITGLINLLDISNATLDAPLSVFALRVIELVGRANPLIIDHSKQEVPRIYRWSHAIKTLELFSDLREFVKIQFFTSVSPKKSIFQDICLLALEHEASLIILPFNKGGVHNHVIRLINLQVLDHAPCSIAILVDNGFLQSTNIGSSRHKSTKHKFAVLFLGGADARETLVYADRMVSNPEVSLTVIRFFTHTNVANNEVEKKLDDGIMTWFWVKNEKNSNVVYRELVVKSGEETIAGIRAINDGSYDLWIVGRKQGINPIFLTGLSEWSENEELGLIGDFVSSPDFPGSHSVLVIQQQILRA